MSVQKRVMNNELLSVGNFVTPFACYRLFYIFVCVALITVYFFCAVYLSFMNFIEKLISENLLFLFLCLVLLSLPSFYTIKIGLPENWVKFLKV